VVEPGIGEFQASSKIEMPWLVKDLENKTDRQLLLVHVPRCGGTSLVKHFNVEGKARREVNFYHKIGLLYFFYRYRLLERGNFPFVTWENLYAFFVISTAFIVFFADPDWGIQACGGYSWCPPPLSITFWFSGTMTFLLSTYVMTAPIMGRRDSVRRLVAFIFGKVLCDFGCAPSYLHGIGWQGYLMHFTAEKMLRHKFISKEDLKDSFAIVRNPFSRMVSIFRYNKMPCESFKSFVKSWKKKLQAYEVNGNTEEWNVYCHVLPMHAFTHHSGEQLVPHIIRQEDLKVLKRPDGMRTEFFRSKFSQIPKKVLEALRDMPHANKRSTEQPWFDLYDQETMDLVLEMFTKDFVHFDFETWISKRPDLKPSKTLQELLEMQQKTVVDASSALRRSTKNATSREVPEIITES